VYSVTVTVLCVPLLCIMIPVLRAFVLGVCTHNWQSAGAKLFCTKCGTTKQL